MLAGAFFLWFFRDPERAIPQDEGAVVSPGDGKVTDVSTVMVGNEKLIRVSIFLSVFDVHVNRSPVAGVVSNVRYQRGKFSERHEHGFSGEERAEYCHGRRRGSEVIFKQIAGLLARRIVFTPKVGDRLQRGQTGGLIKFGSRVDLLFDASAHMNVKVGDRVKGGASVLAYLLPQGGLATTSAQTTERARDGSTRAHTARPTEQGDVHPAIAVHHR